MKNFAIPALAAAFALTACGDSTPPAEEEVTESTTVITPTATETAYVPVEGSTTTVVEEETPAGSSVTIDGRDVDATISEDGVRAEVRPD